MLHPFTAKRFGEDTKKMIEADIHGETKFGKPHGLCFVNYIDKDNETISKP